MTKRSPLSTRSIALVAFTAALTIAGYGIAQELKGIKSLREAPLSDESHAPEVLKQATPADGFGRAYRQQPPLIPHKTDGYEVTINFNKCMDCHAWSRYRENGATKVSLTHFKDRDGGELSNISPRRYFCMQCHVPQTDAKPLVANSFRRAEGMR